MTTTSIKTIRGFKKALKEGKFSLNEIADILINHYNKPNEDFPIINVLYDLGCAVLSSDLDFDKNKESLNKIYGISSVPKCGIINDKAVTKEIYNKDKDYVINLYTNNVGLTEELFWLSYCLGYLIKYDNMFFMFDGTNIDDDCYKFAIKLLLPNIK